MSLNFVIFCISVIEEGLIMRLSLLHHVGRRVLVLSVERGEKEKGRGYFVYM